MEPNHQSRWTAFLWTAAIALGLVALGSASATWIGGMLGLTFASLTAAILFAVFRKGQSGVNDLNARSQTAAAFSIGGTLIPGQPPPPPAVPEPSTLAILALRSD